MKKEKLTTGSLTEKDCLLLEKLQPIILSLAGFWGLQRKNYILNRYQVLKARLITSDEVFEYFDKVKKLIKESNLIKKIDEIIAIHKNYVNKTGNKLRKSRKSIQN